MALAKPVVNNGQGGDGLGFREGVVLLEDPPRLNSRPHLHSKVAGRSQQEAALRLNTKRERTAEKVCLNPNFMWTGGVALPKSETHLPVKAVAQPRDRPVPL